jgi:MAS20 protein import receptor
LNICGAPASESDFFFDQLGSNDNETGQQLESIAFRSRTYLRRLHIVDLGSVPASSILSSSLSANTSLLGSHNDEDINGGCHLGWHSGRRTTRYGLLKFKAPGWIGASVNGADYLPIAYAAYFDHKRRTDPGFRKALKRESRRQAKLAKEEAEIQEQQQETEIKQAVEEAIEEGFPKDLEEREAFFMQQIASGEQLAGEGALTWVITM